jgi:sialidase-1
MKIDSTGETIHTFRIPSLLRVGKTNTLLAFAEGRKFSGSDYGPKALCMRSSPDLGVSFGPLVAIVNHGNASFMNPNAIWDDKTQTVILQFTYIQCNLDCKGGGDCCDDKFLGHEAPSLFQVISTDGGRSFSAPVSLDDELGVPGLTMGPGIGIQIPSTGKLLAMGKGYATGDLFSGHDVVIASDDNGKHWRTAHIFNDTDGVGLDEPQLALLPNGYVMANMRTTNTRQTCSCRAVSLSTDMGESFGPVSSDA